MYLLILVYVSDFVLVSVSVFAEAVQGAVTVEEAVPAVLAVVVVRAVQAAPVVAKQMKKIFTF